MVELVTSSSTVTSTAVGAPSAVPPTWTGPEIASFAPGLVSCGRAGATVSTVTRTIPESPVKFPARSRARAASWWSPSARVTVPANAPSRTATVPGSPAPSTTSRTAEASAPAVPEIPTAANRVIVRSAGERIDGTESGGTVSTVKVIAKDGSLGTPSIDWVAVAECVPWPSAAGTVKAQLPSPATVNGPTTWSGVPAMVTSEARAREAGARRRPGWWSRRARRPTAP